MSLSDEASAVEVGPAIGAEDALALIESALDRQVAHAIFRAAIDPAEYLTALLGARPNEEPHAAGWDSRAENVENFRHRELGLSYGIPAGECSETDPLRRAVGDIRTNPVIASGYDQILLLYRAHAAVLDL